MSETDPLRSAIILIVEVANGELPSTKLVLPSKCATQGLKTRKAVRSACVSLSDKLWMMANYRRKRYIALDLSNAEDSACQALVQCLPVLGQLLRANDKTLAIAKGADPEFVRWALDYVRNERHFPFFVDPVMPPPPGWRDRKMNRATDDDRGPVASS